MRIVSGTSLTASATTALVLAGMTWWQIQPEYELRARVGCDASPAGTDVDFAELVRALQAPPQAMGDTSVTSGWPFGDLLSIGSVRFDVDGARSTVWIHVRTPEPDRALKLCRVWLDERMRAIGTNSVSQRIDAFLAGLEVDEGLPNGAAEAHRSAVSTLLDLRDQLTEQQQKRTEALSALTALRKEAPPRGVVDPAERAAALAEDVRLQQDLRHLYTRCAQIRGELMIGLKDALEASARLEPAVDALRFVIRDLQERRVTGRAVGVLPVLATFARSFDDERENLHALMSGSLEGLKATEAQDARAVLDILDRLDAEVRVWVEATEEDLARYTEVVDELTEGRETSVRQVVVQNRLKRGLFALDSGFHTLSARLAGLRRDWSVQLDAWAGSVSGLLKRTAFRRSEIEARLQAQADADACASRRARLGRLEQELEQARRAEHALIARFPNAFDTMISLETVVLDGGLAAQRAALLETLRRRFDEIARDPLEGLVLTSSGFVTSDKAINGPQRVRLSALVGGSGGVFCLLVLVMANAIRGAAWGGRRSGGRPRAGGDESDANR